MNGIVAKTIITVDIIVPKQTPNGLSVLLIRRKKMPYQDMWALPGGKLDESDSTLEAAACRELREETGIAIYPSDLSQVGTFGNVNRDPRGRYISVAYMVPPLGMSDEATPQAGDDASDAQWWPIDTLPPLAFDHEHLLAVALRTLEQAVAA